jgi:hypothetical protein
MKRVKVDFQLNRKSITQVEKHLLSNMNVDKQFEDVDNLGNSLRVSRSKIYDKSRETLNMVHQVEK